MSWDASLYDDRGHYEGDWNYTHNTNRMIGAALVDLGNPEGADIPTGHPIWNAIGPSWWSNLDGKTGPEGQKFLVDLVRELRANPAKYQAMNPPNGWGSYDTLLDVLDRMIKAVPEWPTTWAVSG